LQIQGAPGKALACFLLDIARREDDCMPIPQTPRRPRAKAPRENFIFKSMLVASALFATALVMVEAELYVSAPSHSLSEAEVTLRMTAK
jgi:hypothetical protein